MRFFTIALTRAAKRAAVSCGNPNHTTQVRHATLPPAWRMQECKAISGALQMAGGIILLLAEGNCVLVPIISWLLARAFALLSFGVRWVEET